VREELVDAPHRDCVGDRSGPSLWRVFAPFKALQASGYPAFWDYKDADGIGALAPSFDGYVLPRISWQPPHRKLAEAWFASIRAAGKFVVFDADDDLFTSGITRRALDTGMHEGKSFGELEAERFERIWAMQQCDGVTVSTPRLATVLRSYTNKPVVVVPNAIDVPWFRRVLAGAERQTAALTVGWAGGRRTDRDVEAMAEGWRRLSASHAYVQFVVAGHVPQCIVDAVPPDRLVVLPWLALEHYPSGLAEIDIGCASVADAPFERCKSPIKAYEYAVAGACVVATPTVYGQVLKHGVHGFLAETADEWHQHLVTLVERPALRSIMAKRLLKHVERHCSLAENAWRWPAAWQQVAEDARARRGKLVLA
jgi:glycosyltransferase involved in cell wall biosynthesis